MTHWIFACFVLTTYWSCGLCQVNISQVVGPLVLSEGPHWDCRRGVLFFVDLTEQLVNRYDPVSGEYTRIKIEGGSVSLVIPVYNSTDLFVATRGRDIVLFSWDGRNSTQPANVQVIASVEPVRLTNYLNDGKADTSGRLWTGTVGPQLSLTVVVPYQAKLYSLDPGSSVAVPRVPYVSLSNGLAWSASNTIFYYVDSTTQQVSAFDFNITTAKLDNRRVIFDLKKNGLNGFPDGMTIDNKGNLWVACFLCWKVLNINPRTQELVGFVEMPASQVTSAIFGGPNLETLYVTTARVGLTEEELKKQPLAGSVFAVTGLGVRAQAPENKVVLTKGDTFPDSRQHCDRVN